VKVRPIHVALALSVLVHATALWKWMPQLRLLSEPRERLEARAPLVVELEPQPPPQPHQRVAPSPAPRVHPPQPRPRPPAPPRTAAPRTQAAPPPVIALTKPEPATRPAPIEQRPPAPEAAPAPVPSEPVAGDPARAAPQGDLASYIEARRRAREGSRPAPPPSVPAPAEAEDENARANRIVAGNLGLGRKPAFGEDARKGGGIFQMQRMTYDYAEFVFYGWNKEIRRNTAQLIEVRKGTHSDIRVAVVRSMIGIIRNHEQGDFLWESRRLGRDVMLSARPGDDAGLASFLMREFFEEPRESALSRVR